MQRDFPATRTLLVLSALVLVLVLVLDEDRRQREPGPAPASPARPDSRSPARPDLSSSARLDSPSPARLDSPSPARPDSPSPARPDSPSWEEELLAPDIQALWHERRSLLDDLSHAYRMETDAARRDSLRCEMERVITDSERDIHELRLRNARRAGHQALAAWLEHARASLPADPPAADGSADR